jgi:hypothetical protein
MTRVDGMAVFGIREQQQAEPGGVDQLFNNRPAHGGARLWGLPINEIPDQD